MSITLITAVPGGGKTSYAVWHIIKPAVEAGRIVYCNAIPKLKLPTLPVSRDDVKTWAEREPVDENDLEGVFRLKNFAEGSLIIADEIQYLWPATGSKEPPEHIKYLTQHRKHGLDFVLITQSPHLVHSHVLQVVDKHIHIVPTWSGRKMFEWPEYCAQPKARTNQINAVKTQYKIPEQSFDLYYSASKHTKVERKIPAMLYVSIFVLLLVPFFIYLATSSVLAKLSDDGEAVEVVEEKETEEKTGIVKIHPGQNDDQPADTGRILPTLLTQEYDWDRVSACLQSEKIGCVCYGLSSERLVIPLETCQLATKHGWTQTKIRKTNAL